MIENKKILKISGCIIFIYIAFCLSFYYLGGEQIKLKEKIHQVMLMLRILQKSCCLEIMYLNHLLLIQHI